MLFYTNVQASNAIFSNIQVLFLQDYLSMALRSSSVCNYIFRIQIQFIAHTRIYSYGHCCANFFVLSIAEVFIHASVFKFTRRFDANSIGLVYHRTKIILWAHCLSWMRSMKCINFVGAWYICSKPQFMFLLISSGYLTPRTQLFLTCAASHRISVLDAIISFNESMYYLR